MAACRQVVNNSTSNVWARPHYRQAWGDPCCYCCYCQQRAAEVREGWLLPLLLPLLLPATGGRCQRGLLPVLLPTSAGHAAWLLPPVNSGCCHQPVHRRQCRRPW